MSNKSNGPKKMANPVEIQSYLKGMSYPASKEDVINRGRDNDAPDNIMELLSKIPDKKYSTPAELTREIGAIR